MAIIHAIIDWDYFFINPKHFSQKIKQEKINANIFKNISNGEYIKLNNYWKH